MGDACPQRLYHTGEIKKIMNDNGMKMIRTYNNFTDKEITDADLQMEVYSQKL